MFNLDVLFSPSNIFLFMAIFTRLSGLMRSAPLFSTYPIPVQVKVWICALIAFILFPIVQMNTSFIAPTTVPALTMILVKEFLIGFAIGFCANLLFVGIELGVNTFTVQMGLSADQALNPASGGNSHAEGLNTTASGEQSHAEGSDTTASGSYSHAEGYNTKASSTSSHAEGFFAKASGSYSHAEGSNTTALAYQHAQGCYNDTSVAKANTTGSTTGTAFVIGNGGGTFFKSNAFRVQGDGAVYAKSAYIKD